jgi:hypothetical protein
MEDRKPGCCVGSEARMVTYTCVRVSHLKVYIGLGATNIHQELDVSNIALLCANELFKDAPTLQQAFRNGRIGHTWFRTDAIL